MTSLTPTDPAMLDWYRALMLAKDAQRWRERARTARQRGESAWPYVMHARDAELRLRCLADRIERSGQVALQP